MPTLASLIGNRIYWEDPSQRAAYPCVVVKVPDRDYGHNLDGADGTSQATVEVTVIALSEALCVQIAGILRNNFDGFRGLQSGVAVQRCFLTGETDETVAPPDGSDQWIYEITLEYRVMHRVPAPASVTQTNV